MFRKLWLLLPLFMLFACGHVNVASNKDTAYSKKLERVLISLSLDKTYLTGQTVALSFSDKLNKRGVVVQTIVPNPLELEGGNALKATIATFRPSQVMGLVATSITSNQYGPVAFTLEGSIYDSATKKRVWRSSIRFSGSFGNAQANADKFVDTVIQQLEADGLLPAV
jgi:hypothetical protein